MGGYVKDAKKREGLSCFSAVVCSLPTFNGSAKTPLLSGRCPPYPRPRLPSGGAKAASWPQRPEGPIVRSQGVNVRDSL